MEVNDLISRQAAVAEIEKPHDINLGVLPVGHRSYDDILRCVGMAYDKGIAHAVKVLGALPFAQPEIIRCGKCTHKDKKIDYCHYLGITICESDYCSYAERRTDATTI